MKITKAMAAEVARKLTEKKQAEIDQLEKNISNIVRDMYMEKIPEDIKKLFTSHKRYFKDTTGISVQGSGINYYYVKVESAPFTNNSILYPTTQQADQIIDLIDQMTDKRLALNELKNNIEALLLSLSTYNRVAKEFPEAVPYISRQTSVNLPMVNIESLRESLAA